MSYFKRTALALIASVGFAAPGLGQVEELPAFAYDMVTEVTMATTADAKCDGITTRPKKLQNYIIEMYGQLAKVNISAPDAAKHFESERATAEIAGRDAALRAKHGVAAEGTEALCAAIRAEAHENKPFATLMRIK